MDNQEFGHTLRMLRTTAGIGLRELAKKIDVSPAYLSQVESGKLSPPTAGRISKIAEIIGIPVSPLFELSERLSPEVLGLLQSKPEIGSLILALGQIGFDSQDFLNLAALARNLGREGFLRFLLYGREHNLDFRSSSTGADRINKSPVSEPVLRMLKFLDTRLVFPSLHLSQKNDALHFLINKAGLIHPRLEVKDIFNTLSARENKTSSGLGHHVALPHLFVKGLTQTIIALAKFPEGIDFDSIDQKPVHFICLVLDGPQNTQSHVGFLAYLARNFCHHSFPYDLRRARTKKQLISLVLKPSQLNQLEIIR